MNPWKPWVTLVNPEQMVGFSRKAGPVFPGLRSGIDYQTWEVLLDAKLGAGLGHGQAGVAAGTVDEEQDGGGDAVLLDVVAQVVDDVEEGVRYIFGKTVSHDIFKWHF